MSSSEIGLSTRFQPGQSGNPRGRPKSRRLSDMLVDALEEDGPDGRSNAQAVVDRWLDLVLHGEPSAAIAALRELLTRLEGRAPLKVNVEADVYHHEHDDGDMYAIFNALSPGSVRSDGSIVLPPGIFGTPRPLPADMRSAVGVAIGAATAAAILDDQADDIIDIIETRVHP
jgi:Family of unknown function (DUF5681)